MTVTARAAVLGLLILLAACSDGDAGAGNAVNGAADNGAANVATAIVGNAIAAASDNGAAPGNGVAPPAQTAAPPPPRPPASPRRDDSYRAIGTEPFWNLTIRGGRGTLTRPDRPPLPTGDLTRTDDDRAVRYQGEGFTATITPGPCSDGMSDAIWSDRVQIAFAEGVLKGCGGEREMPEEE